MGKNTILVVDDEKEIVEVLAAYLEREDYEVLKAYDGRAALDIARRDEPDLILLDLMLPEVNGFEVCKLLRVTSSVPIIMLTARDEETDKILCLEVGADDYITKPFSPREVLARVRAVLRRAVGEVANAEKLRLGEIAIDLAKHEVTKAGEAIALTPTEFKLLEAMARNPGRVFTRLQLIDYIQGYSFEGYERTIDAHVKNLRQKIEANPKTSRYIVTVFGVGYRMEESNDA
ncbi:MAG: response regulator transcription factor [Candidatus Aquicultor sp.]|nr:response regulator transcription factor [Candidatus Aquicultor sp.]